MAKGASPRAMRQQGNERDSEHERVRETLVEILIEIPRFQTLKE